MRFEFSHTHIYPGAKARVAVGGERSATADCVVEFSDGIVVPGGYTRADEVIVLHVPAYRSARGTRIVIKQWQLQSGGAPEQWRVRRRLADDAPPAR